MRKAFDGAAAYTVGLEDEVMLLDPETLHLAPRAQETIELLDADPRFKLELPASQLEILTPPAANVPAAASALLEARGVLKRAGEGRGPPPAGGLSPPRPP